MTQLVLVLQGLQGLPPQVTAVRGPVCQGLQACVPVSPAVPAAPAALAPPPPPAPQASPQPTGAWDEFRLDAADIEPDAKRPKADEDDLDAMDDDDAAHAALEQALADAQALGAGPPGQGPGVAAPLAPQ